MTTQRETEVIESYLEKNTLYGQYNENGYITELLNIEAGLSKKYALAVWNVYKKDERILTGYTYINTEQNKHATFYMHHNSEKISMNIQNRTFSKKMVEGDALTNFDQFKDILDTKFSKNFACALQLSRCMIVTKEAAFFRAASRDFFENSK